ncbi:two component system response regulator [Candidatus Hamiltonella defensa]|uniref:two component system response regulator n=1 Tax=Candidatus Williamhamiltonella defendens TaxID=138072 RepID=UPI000D601485|nr:two component system response regulator [Candidatus Hamiltonella defensa]AWK17422.1 DNA-binding response regulator [Candidatus Hamiltonella defensa]MBK4361799.1 two component system response regulator [Candidatus Hamiltonella defensa]
MNIKILIVDDHELIINGIKNMLAPYKGYQVVGQTENGLDVYNLCVETEPDMVILDLGLPGMNGQEVILRLHRRWPKLRILVLTAREEEHYASQTLKIGALGYVIKKSTQQILMAAVQTVLAGKQYIDPTLHVDSVLTLIKKSGASPSILTSRERQILKLITEGRSNRIIADRLYISEKTVERHRLNMMRKLNVHKLAQLIQWSQRLGLNF